MRARRNGLSQRIRDALLGVPVFVKVMGIALGMALVLGAGMLWQIHQTWHAHMLRDLDQRGHKLGHEVYAHCADLARAGLSEEMPNTYQARAVNREQYFSAEG